MTVFNRNDKIPDPAPRVVATPVSDKPEAPAPISAEPKRPQAVVQPLGSSVGAQTTPSVSVISRALKITGQLESTENIQIDGEIDGDVRGVSVKVGSNAKVKGAVYGDEVELSGTIDGKIEARKVVLTSSAHMTGDVIHQDITIHSGAYVAGHCRPEFGKGENRTPIQAKPKEAYSRD